MELLESQKTKEEWKFPKNIRQVGEPGTGRKILIEDYVYTFLHQMTQNNLTCIKTAVLTGRTEGETAVCIQGALEVDMGQEVREWFSHEHWREIFREAGKWFDGQEIVGWYMANPGFSAALTEELKDVHIRNFQGNSCVFFQMDVLDQEEIFYIQKGNSMVSANGYYIYYEKNDRMQEYMSRKKGGRGIEPEGILKDRAAAKFRNVMQEKREQNSQKKLLAFLYTSCMFLVLVILVIGVTMVNNYDRMANMEDALHQISESLVTDGEEEQPVSASSVEEGMEEENRQALADGTSEQTSGPEEGSDPEEAVPEKEPEGAASEESAVTEETASEGAASEETVSEEATVTEGTAPEETDGQEEAQEPQETSQEREPERYRVRAGDTLLNICRQRYGNDDMVAKVCELNGLEDGDIIYAGEMILLP